MEYTQSVETHDFFVKYKNDKATKETIFEMVVKFFLDHETFSGEAIAQCDAPQIDAVEFLTSLSERIGFDVECKEK